MTTPDACVCSLTKDDLSARERWLASFAVGIGAHAELADGFECRFPPEWAERLFELIQRERACCTSLSAIVRPLGEGALLGVSSWRSTRCGAARAA